MQGGVGHFLEKVGKFLQKFRQFFFEKQNRKYLFGRTRKLFDVFLYFLSLGA